MGAKGLRPLNWVYGTNILHTASIGMSMGGICAMVINIPSRYVTLFTPYLALAVLSLSVKLQ